MSRKPEKRDFDAPNETAQNLKKKLEKLEPKKANKSDRDMSMMVITIIVVSILVAVLLASMEGDFELWMIAPGGIIGALIFTTIVGPRMDVEVKIPNKVKDEISKLKEKLARREAFEVAIDKWNYENIISKDGYWINKKDTALELAVKTLLESQDWKVQTTKKVGDGGIDLIAKKNKKKILIQCKGHSMPLGVGAIRDAAGVKMTSNSNEMIVVAPNGFSKGSIEFANKSGIILLNVKDLVKIAKKRKDYF